MFVKNDNNIKNNQNKFFEKVKNKGFDILIISDRDFNYKNKSIEIVEDCNTFIRNKQKEST